VSVALAVRQSILKLSAKMVCDKRECSQGEIVMDRFLLDNDSSNFITRFSLDDIETTVEEVVRECPPNVTTILLCSGAGTCYWPTTIGHVDPRAQGLIAAHAHGIDPLGDLLQRLKDAGKETFITYRMNDVHNPMDADQWNTPRIRRENPDCIVGLDEVRENRADSLGAYTIQFRMMR